MFDYNLLPFFVSMVLLVFIFLAIGIHFYRNTVVMFIIIPVAMFCTFFGYNTITNLLGYPVQQSIPEEAMYLSHIQNGDGTELYVWVLEPERLQPKNFRIPATEQNKKQFQTANARSKNGIPQLIKPEKKKGDRLGETNDGDYLTYDFTIDGGNLKLK